MLDRAKRKTDDKFILKAETVYINIDLWSVFQRLNFTKLLQQTIPNGVLLVQLKLLLLSLIIDNNHRTADFILLSIKLL